jgi:hypothetical protein
MMDVSHSENDSNNRWDIRHTYAELDRIDQLLANLPLLPVMYVTAVRALSERNIYVAIKLPMENAILYVPCVSAPSRAS